MASERRVAGAIRSLVNARSLQGLHESLLLPFVKCGSETMICMEKETSMIRAVQWTTSDIC